MTAAVERDTICAVATPEGAGGVGIVRVSGPRAVDVAARLVGRLPESFQDRRVVAAVARDPETGERLDQVLVVVMRAPRSYTGEDVAEVHGHGGALNMARLLRAACVAGARLAEPGEFTRRAFLSGRIDLTRAEAVAAVIGATSERALRVAQSQLAGGIGRQVRGLWDRAAALRAEVEAAIDFPEEDLDFLPADVVAARAEELATEATRLADTYAVGRALRDGIEVAIVGPPNVGKSSLLNALCEEERAVVTDEPGTTRDYVEARVVWDGIPVVLIDTAGEREAESVAERRGVELGRRRAARADVVVRLVDATRPETRGARAGAAELEVWNKVDLAESPAGTLAVSATRGHGLDELRRVVLARALGDAREGAEGDVVSSERQRALLVEAGEAAHRAAALAREGRPWELAAVELRAAAQALGRILGESVDEAMLDSLFARFCIGK